MGSGRYPKELGLKHSLPLPTEVAQESNSEHILVFLEVTSAGYATEHTGVLVEHLLIQCAKSRGLTDSRN